MLRTVHRYIFTQWLASFAMVALATLGLLHLEDWLDDGADYLRAGATASEIFQYYLALAPGLLTTVLPVAWMVSLLIMLSSLHRSGQWTALRAAALSPFTLTKSLWIAALVLCATMLWLKTAGVPQGQLAADAMRDTWRFREQAQKLDAVDVGLVRSLTHENIAENRLWVINRYSRYSGRAYGITVHTRDGQGREIFRTVAEEGFYEATENHWVLQGGMQISFNPQTRAPLRLIQFQRKAFKTFTENPEHMALLRRDSAELSYTQLSTILNVLGHAHPRRPSYASTQASMLASAALPLLLLGMAVPLATRGARTSGLTYLVQAAAALLLYGFLQTTTQALSAQSLLGPHSAAWLPAILFGALCTTLWCRIR